MKASRWPIRLARNASRTRYSSRSASNQDSSCACALLSVSRAFPSGSSRNMSAASTDLGSESFIGSASFIDLAARLETMHLRIQSRARLEAQNNTRADLEDRARV